ncbi:MAG: thioredoxin family protein [Hyphomicrobiales bacterium]|nr:thioredoxin family protein [Hyphomicrobiales bacterium]
MTRWLNCRFSQHSLAVIASVWLIPCAVFVSGSPASAAAPVIGDPAPDFTATDSHGQTQSLSSHKGSVVVLEWTNHECPYTAKHYEAGAMQALQRDATQRGIVWLSVISSAPGRQGYVTPKQANDLTESRDASPTAVILDPSGVIGRQYDATATPHMYVIDASGRLVYMGAIDDDPSARGNPDDASNYVRAAIDDVLAGRPVATSKTRAYGCSIKYGS